MKPNRWLKWAWKIAFATYVAGALTLLQGSSVIVFWTVILYTPLIIWTLAVTRSRFLAAAMLPVLGAALFAAGHLLYVFKTAKPMPQSALFQAIWFIGVLGPLALYPVVSRYVAVASRE